MSPIRRPASALLILTALIAACASDSASKPALQTRGEAARQAPRPAPLMHLVYVRLIDPSQASDLIADADAMLATIPTATAYFCGPHKETGRATVDGDYDVAMGIGFADLAGYQAYLDDPAHVRFVAIWRPRCAWLRIHDVEDGTP